MSRLAAVAAVAALLAVAAGADAQRPVFAPYMGHAGLAAAPSSSGRRVTHSFSHTNAQGKEVHLKYDATHSEHVELLDSDTRVEAVACGEDSLVITFTDAAAAAAHGWTAGSTMLVGGREWGCTVAVPGSPTGARKPSSIMRRVLTITAHSPQSRLLTVGTEDVSHKDVFEHAHVVFRTSQLQRAGADPGAVGADVDVDASGSSSASAAGAGAGAGAGGAGGRRLHHWFHHLVHKIGHAIHKVVHTVVSVVKAVFTGDIHWSKNPFDKSFSWNYANGGAAKQLSLYKNNYLDVVCTECYVHANLLVHFELDVEHFRLELAEAYVQATLGASVRATATAHASYRSSGNVPQHEIQLATIHFMVGPVPVVLDFTVPIAMHYDVHATAKVELDMGMWMSASYKLGVQYSHSGGLKWINTHSYNHGHNLKLDDGIGRESSLTAAVAPGLKVELERLLSAEVDLYPGVQATVQPTGACHSGYQIQLDWSIGLQLRAGINIDLHPLKTIHIGNWQSPDWTKTGELFHVCVPVYSRRALGGRASSASGARALAAPMGTAFNSTGGGLQGPMAVVNATVPQPAGPEPPTCFSGGCVVAAGLTACPHMNGKSVCAASLDALLGVDKAVGETLRAVRPEGRHCFHSMQEYACHIAMPECMPEQRQTTPNTTYVQCVDANACADAMSVCGLDEDETAHVCGGCVQSGTCPVHSEAAHVMADMQPASVDPIAAAASADTDADGTCVLASGLGFCHHVNGRQVFVDSDMFANALEADALAEASVAAEALATNDCIDSLRFAACAEFLPECDTGAAKPAPLPLCGDACVSMYKACPGTVAQAAELCGKPAADSAAASASGTSSASAAGSASASASSAECGYVDFVDSLSHEALFKPFVAATPGGAAVGQKQGGAQAPAAPATSGMEGGVVALLCVGALVVGAAVGVGGSVALRRHNDSRAASSGHGSEAPATHLRAAMDVPNPMLARKMSAQAPAQAPPSAAAATVASNA